MRYYVISDVHGYYTQMKSALEKAGFFSDTTPHKLIMLGDLFGRGHEAKQLKQFILEQMEQDKIILIRGNHEDLFVELVTTDAGMPYSYHKSNGTYDTALQLTGFDPVMASIRHYDFADAAKDTPFYKEIIPAMLDYFETEHYVFTHGWIPSIPNRDKSYSYISSWREADREQWNQARWFNGMDAAQTADENKTIVCGHWLEMSRNVQSGNTQNLKSMVIQRSFPKRSVAERRKTVAASDQAAVCACAHSRYFTGGSPSGLRV